MSRTLLPILYALIATIYALGDEPHLESALVAAAQNSMPEGIDRHLLIKSLESGLWNSDRKAVAVSVPQKHPKESLVFIFMRQPNGRYLAADAIGVEAGNFGKLGLLPRADYERFETKPVEWLDRDDELFQVRIRTRAWRNGQRYTVYEPLIIRPDGTVVYR